MTVQPADQWTAEDVEAATPGEVLQAMKSGLLQDLGVGDGRDRRGYLPEDYRRGLPAPVLAEAEAAHRARWRRWRAATADGGAAA
ncbi:MAG TPA: hypothetical protein VLW50_01620 [Streptosporangiaceae bacterium]|nr:hypothetical protein [Streptosporangiaceae bacterium]